MSERHLNVSTSPIGQYPSACKASAVVARPDEVKIKKVMREQTTQLSETDAMRARITEGASRVRVGDGLVLGDR